MPRVQGRLTGRRSGKPVFLAANKVDGERQEPEAAALWSLGLGEPHPISAIHGRGVADLLDAVVADLPEASTSIAPDTVDSGVPGVDDHHRADRDRHDRTPGDRCTG